MSRCYTQITLADRRRLHQLVAAKVPINEMARQLGRHRSTIYREIKRNTFHDRELPEYDGYYSTVAQDISNERRRRLRSIISVDSSSCRYQSCNTALPVVRYSSCHPARAFASQAWLHFLGFESEQADGAHRCLA